MVAGNYGANRAEAELVAQYGGAGGGRTAVGAGGGAATAAGYGGNQQASVYGGISGGRGPAGTLCAQSLSRRIFNSWLQFKSKICLCQHITPISQSSVLCCSLLTL